MELDEPVEYVLANRDVTLAAQAAAGVLETRIQAIANAIGATNPTAVAELAKVLSEPAAGIASQPDSSGYTILPRPNPFMALAAGLIAAALGSDNRLAYVPTVPPLRDYEIEMEWHEGAWAFAVWVAAGGAMSRSAPTAAGRTQLLAPEVGLAYARAARAAAPQALPAAAYAPLYSPCLDAWTDTTRDPRRARAAAAVVAGHRARVAVCVPEARAAGAILGSPNTSRYNWDEMVRVTAQFAPAEVARRLGIEHDTGIVALCTAIGSATPAGDAASGDAFVRVFTDLLASETVLLAAALAIPPGALGTGADADQARQRIATAIVARMPGVLGAARHTRRATIAARAFAGATARLAAARAVSADSAIESGAELECELEQATRLRADMTAAAVADALASVDVSGRLHRLRTQLAEASPDLAFAFSVLDLTLSPHERDDRAGLQDWFLKTGPARWQASTWLGFEIGMAEGRPETRGDAGNAAVAGNEDVLDAWIAARAAVRGKRPRASAWPTAEWPGGCGLEPLGFAPLVGAVLAMPWGGPRGARAARTRTLIRQPAVTRLSSAKVRAAFFNTDSADAKKHLCDVCRDAPYPYSSHGVHGVVGAAVVRYQLRVAAYQIDEPGTLADLIRRIPRSNAAGADAASADAADADADADSAADGWLGDLAEGVAAWRAAIWTGGVLGLVEPGKCLVDGCAQCAIRARGTRAVQWSAQPCTAHLRRIAPWVALALALAAPAAIIACAGARAGRDRLAREIALAAAVGDAVGNAARADSAVRARAAYTELSIAQREFDQGAAELKSSGADFERGAVTLRRIKSAK
jgi:hypothetical protein